LSIKITAGSNSYTLNPPEYGYVSTVNMSLEHVKRSPKSLLVYDHGAGFDHRTCKCKFLMNESDTNTLIDIFDTDARGGFISLRLPKNSGFYPFGPDRGDSGKFQCRMLSIDPSPVMEEPYKYSRVMFELKEHAYPAYTPPAQVAEGGLQIGTVTGLLYPQKWPEPDFSWGIDSKLTFGGEYYALDKDAYVDSQETKLKMRCNQSNAAALIAHLAGVVRGNYVTIQCPADSFIFGTQTNSSTTHSAIMLNKKIDIKHTGFNEFEFELNLYRYLSI